MNDLLNTFLLTVALTETEAGVVARAALSAKKLQSEDDAKRFARPFVSCIDRAIRAGKAPHRLTLSRVEDRTVCELAAELASVN